MDRRQKILGIAFVAVLAVVIGGQTVYPWWIKPIFALDTDIAEMREKLATLEADDDAAKKAREDLRAYAMRTGSYEPLKVENEIRERLNRLIDKHKLEEVSVAPNRAVQDSKFKFSRLLVTVTATGTLNSAVDFMKDLAELPGLVRVTNPAVYPSNTGKRDAKSEDRVSLRLPLEMLILDKTGPSGKVAKDDDLKQPDKYVRHTDKNYAMIAERSIFWEPKPPAPPPPPPPPPRDPPVETKKPDPVIEKPPPPPPPPPITPNVGLPDGQTYQLAMVLAREDSSKSNRVDEVAVRSLATMQTEFVKLGGKFDDGQLVHVTPRGVVVYRRGAYFAFALGHRLDQEIDALTADQYPDLRRAAERIRDFNKAAEDEKQKQAEQAAAAAQLAAKDAAVEKPADNAEKPSAPTSEPATQPARGSLASRIGNAVQGDVNSPGYYVLSGEVDSGPQIPLIETNRASSAVVDRKNMPAPLPAPNAAPVSAPTKDLLATLPTWPGPVGPEPNANELGPVVGTAISPPAGVPDPKSANQPAGKPAQPVRTPPRRPTTPPKRNPPAGQPSGAQPGNSGNPPAAKPDS